MQGYHQPVLLEKILEAINIEKGVWYIDCTLGDGGYSLEILRRGGNIIGIDVDLNAIERAGARFSEEGIKEDRFEMVQGNFSEMGNLVLRDDKKIMGVIFDLGVSTMQLKTPSRGFSFLENGPLDMRMDPNLGVGAEQLINAGTAKELENLFTKYGGETQSYRFAKAIVLARELKPITTTLELAKILEKASRTRRGKIHPATRVFQALRIAVNDELGVLEQALPKVLQTLDDQGFIVVVSFHSLEDRIVKNKFKDFTKDGFGSIITKKPIVPTEMEVSRNPASRSGKLRIFQKNGS